MSGVRTLIVDDDFMVANIHRAYTDRVPGFEVVGLAHTGAEALAAIDRLRPDLLVLDIYLPDMSGLTVLQELRQRQTPLDVILVTAARDVDAFQAAMAGGALHYIVKPFDFTRYSETLQTYRRFRGQRSALQSLEQLEQTDVDRLYATMRAAPESVLPKGLNRPTLELIVRHLQQQASASSAQEVADGTGVSRGTARRYLDYLETQGRLSLELRYGAAGRPEHRYRLVTTNSS